MTNTGEKQRFRAAPPLHQKESLEVVWAADWDAY